MHGSRRHSDGRRRDDDVTGRDRLDERDDELARRAARLVADGEANDVGAALRTLGADARLRGRARRHLEGIEQSEGGGGSTHRRRAEALEVAIAVMEAIEDLEERTADRGVPFAGVRLAGHAATGRIAPGEPLHLRHHGDRSIDDLARELEDLGAVEIRLGSMSSRWGRLSWVDGVLDGVPIRLRRCPVGQVPLASGNLVTGASVPIADLAEVRRRRAACDDVAD